jgi:exodeoxyribonuclease VIII
MKPGVYDGITNAEYHSGPGISNSGLSLVRRSPLHYRARVLAANDNAPTAAQAIGTAFHALLLEPEVFYSQYCLGLRMSDAPDAIDSRDQLVDMVTRLNAVRLPKLATTGTKAELIERLVAAMKEMDTSSTAQAADFEGMTGTELKEHLNTLNKERHGLLSTSGTMDQLATMLRAEGIDVKLWKDAKAEWMANNGHRTVLEPEAWDQLMSMRDAVMAHPKARAILDMEGVAERSVYWLDKATGVLCRCRPDWWVRKRGIILDVKTTEDASPEGFGKSIANWSYDTQDAFYTDGCEAIGEPLRAFLFLAVEKSARVVDGKPLGVGVYQLDDAGRDVGRAKYREDLAVYAQCQATGIWPCYGDNVQAISLPQWHVSKHAHLLEQSA